MRSAESVDNAKREGKNYRVFTDGNDADIMTGGMVVDTPQICQYALFRRVVWEGTLINYKLRTLTI